MKNSVLFCCDPFKCHKKKISSGVLCLPENVYNICQKHNIDIDKDVGVCVNCLKKLQTQTNGNSAELVSKPTMMSMNKVNIKNDALVCCDPFKTHKKPITSGVTSLPKNLYANCQTLNVDIDENAQICINCLKKLQGPHNENSTNPVSEVDMSLEKQTMLPISEVYISLEKQNESPISEVDMNLEKQNVLPGVCCDPFKTHKNEITSTVTNLPKNVYVNCQRLNLEIDENSQICIDCLNKLQDEHENSANPISETDTKVDVKSSMLPVVCCDPFKTHKKEITSGVVILPQNVYSICQTHDMNIVENARICINCLKKLSEWNTENTCSTKFTSNASTVLNINNVNPSGLECCNPFKTHKKQITSGVVFLPKNVYVECQSFGVDIAENAVVCINCLKKLHTQKRESITKRTSFSPQRLSTPEKEILDEVLPDMGIGQVKMEAMSPHQQVSKVLSMFTKVDTGTSRKRELSSASDGASTGEKQRKKKRAKKEELQVLHTMAEKTMGETANGNGPRGALIVLEGCDRTGKTTQAKKLVESLVAAEKSATFMRFPDRTTKIGSIIDSYLGCASELEDHSVHLLFSANRWELLPKIMSTLHSGTSIIIDRYAFSGVAFSAAKKGMSLEWCKQSDVGLPKPDLVLFLDLNAEEAQRRGQYGEERYEKAEFQKKVYANYTLLQDETWKVIDANNTIEYLQDVLKAEVLKVIDRVKDTQIGKLWV